MEGTVQCIILPGTVAAYRADKEGTKGVSCCILFLVPDIL